MRVSVAVLTSEPTTSLAAVLAVQVPALSSAPVTVTSTCAEPLPLILTVAPDWLVTAPAEKVDVPESCQLPRSRVALLVSVPAMVNVPPPELSNPSKTC